MKSAYIIPTGNEIKNGTVLDMDTPEIISQLLGSYPDVTVTRISPIIDEENAIINKIDEIVKLAPDLLILIGGSGGGHRFSKSLGKDFTHSALDKYLDNYASREIYGKNGHMWSKLICGEKNSTAIINVPGPYVEASAAFKAYLKAYGERKSIDEICFEMADAVLKQFPKDKIEIKK